MHWRISSFTELEHLSEEERKQVLRTTVGPWFTFRMAARAVALSLNVCVPCGALLWILGIGISGFLFLLLWLCLSLAAYQYQLIRIRGQLLLYLERSAKRQRLPMCLRCGYDLTGLTESRCPECGQQLPH